MHTAARILVVDDQAPNVELLERLLRANGYRHITSTTEPRAVVDLFTRVQPDLMLLDLHMPHCDGFAVLQQLAPHLAAERYFPILVLTADALRESRQKALAVGAKDFLAKPFDTVEVVLRIRNLLETRFGYLELERQKRELEQRVLERTRELEETRLEILDRLALAAEYRDDNTGEHTRRVARLARLLADTIGLGRTQVDLISRAAPLHDVGKIGIPDAVLLQPRSLSRREFDIIKGHTTIGAKILAGSRVAVLRVAEEIARGHHERWDGRGYPMGVAGDEIPLAARVTCLADAFDAMTHTRRYKPPVSLDEAMSYICGEKGRQFDPVLVEAFVEIEARGALAVNAVA